MQAVPITKLDQSEEYNIMWSSLSLICDRSVGDFLHHKTNQPTITK